MEECETLCSRLSIMVNGQMKCLGSIQHLKNIYGEGYTISVITKSVNDCNSVQQFLEDKIPGVVLCDSRYKTLTFEVRDVPESLAHLFKILEELLRTYELEDYSVSQNTLDNVSIIFLYDPRQAKSVFEHAQIQIILRRVSPRLLLPISTFYSTQ